MLPVAGVDGFNTTLPPAALPGVAPLVFDRIQPRGELDGIRVLIVDDDADARVLLNRLLTNKGAEVLVACNAREAFHAVECMAPDVLLCDIEMPDEDGYSLIKRVRSLPPANGGALPAAALTAYAREEDRRQATASGFQRHISKPLEPARLVELVAEMARRPVAASSV